VRIFTQPCCAFDEVLGDDHRILKSAVAYAIDRQPSIVIEKLHPDSDCICRPRASWLNQPDLKCTETYESCYC